MKVVGRPQQTRTSERLIPREDSNKRSDYQAMQTDQTIAMCDENAIVRRFRRIIDESITNLSMH
jgi:hypothetical protein